MTPRKRRRLAVFLFLLPMAACGGADPPSDAGLRVVGVEPAAQSRNAPLDAAITIRFDRPVQAVSVSPGSFSAFGRGSGPVEGEYRLSDGGRAVTLVPRRPFTAGEQVMVSLAGIRGDEGPPSPSGYSYRFWTRATRSAMDFEAIGTLSTRGTGGPTRLYGGVASDLDRDGFPDLTTVNEDTADLRVFLNRGDGSGLFHDFLRPPVPVGRRASPSEAADFNRDGRVDLCVANIDANTISVLLGNGDGTFAPAQHVTVGRAPRGIAVLDADGDGDTDIVNTNAESNNLSLLVNDGRGRFGPPVFFEGGGDREWALGSEDMNGDGILDLVVGAHGSQEVVVLAGQGNGRFSRASATPAGGQVWMLACGDLDGDGNADVATANGDTNTASILLGDGRGGLRRGQTLSVGRLVLASDLGDLDGDSDLDWILSSYSGGWTVLRNDGRAAFSVDRAVRAPEAGSCALPLDSDRDGDLDLALIDEIADQVVLLRNR